jgi:hypothetical protein
MKIKLLISRGRRGIQVSQEEVEAFENKINKLHEKYNFQAGNVNLVPAFEHLHLFAVLWYNEKDHHSKKNTISNIKGSSKNPGRVGRPSSLPIYNNLEKGEEIGALWHWKRDGTLRGELDGEKIDIDFDLFKNNVEIKTGEDGEEFYIFEFQSKRLLIFQVKEKVNRNQPDYRIYDGG